MYVQDSITWKNWSFNLGIRGDIYEGLSHATQAEPRLGVAYNIKQTNTVLRASYARTLETPFNENLVLSSIGCLNPVVGALFAAEGEGCTSGTATPLAPGFRNEFHAGLQQAFGKYLVINGEYIWKYTHNGYDFSILGATPITFPIEWNNSKIPGYAISANVPNYHGLTALVVMSSVAARFFTPQIGGVGAVPIVAGSFTPFRIDHDEHFNETTHLQYQPKKLWPWIGFNWRYDSGLVAGPVPCDGGNCAGAQIPRLRGRLRPLARSAVSGWTILRGRVRDSAKSDQSDRHADHCFGLVPLVRNTTSKFLKIPAPGTENDDHNPPRVAARNLFDLAVGDDNLFRGDRYKWSLRLTAINIGNKEAVYNFLSTFSGTHYVTPRALTAEVGFHF